MRDPEQKEHICRVTSAIGKAIMAFCGEHNNFHAEDLRGFIRNSCGSTAPGSADRILRDLRKKRLLNYRVIDRRASLYQVLPVEQLSPPFQMKLLMTAMIDDKGI